MKDNIIKENTVKDNVGEVFLYNNSVIDVAELGRLLGNTNNVIYEVIRIINEVPLFLEDHYERMRNSFMILGESLNIDESSLSNQIKTLVKHNNLIDCNVKIIANNENSTQNIVMYVSSSYYPNTIEILGGVKTGLLTWQRNNPNMKLVNSKYKEEAHRKMQELGAFEVLLVNNEGKITEGSRSNVFFVKNGIVYTSPSDFILKGVTRKYVLEACSRCGIEVVEKLIDANSLVEIEGLFLSGTSIKVLPVKSIENYYYNSGSHPLIIKIRDKYDFIIKEYLEKYLSKNY